MLHTNRNAWALAVIAAVLDGCGDNGGATPIGGVTGADLARRSGCENCHGGAGLSGSDTPVMGSMSYGPNLTPDMDTGLASWTDEQIIRAIRTGIDDEGAMLCPEMPRYSMMPDDEARVLVGYLRSLTPVPHVAPKSQCGDAPGDAGTDDASPDAGEDVTTPDVVPPDVADVTTEATARDAAMDALTDASPDVRADVVMDALADARADAMMDARADAVVDAAADARVDATPDARADAVVDARADAAVDAGPVGCHPVINEVLTGVMGAGTNEWVELYNPCTTAVTLTGWRIGYRAAAAAGAITAADSATLFTFATVTMAPGGYLLLGSAGYTGMVDGRLASGMADAGGGVGLRNAAGTVVDSMGWGTATNAFVRVRAAPSVSPAVAAPGNSIERLPDGADSMNNMADFHIAMRPTPRAANR